MSDNGEDKRDAHARALLHKPIANSRNKSVVNRLFDLCRVRQSVA